MLGAYKKEKENGLHVFLDSTLINLTYSSFLSGMPETMI